MHVKRKPELKPCNGARRLLRRGAMPCATCLPRHGAAMTPRRASASCPRGPPGAPGPALGGRGCPGWGAPCNAAPSQGPRSPAAPSAARAPPRPAWRRPPHAGASGRRRCAPTGPRPRRAAALARAGSVRLITCRLQGHTVHSRGFGVAIGAVSLRVQQRRRAQAM